MVHYAAQDRRFSRSQRIGDFESRRSVGLTIQVIEVLKRDSRVDRRRPEEERVRCVDASEPLGGTLVPKPFPQHRLRRPELAEVPIEEVPIGNSGREPVAAEIRGYVLGAPRPGRKRRLQELRAHEPVGVAVSGNEQTGVGEPRVEPGARAGKLLEPLLIGGCANPEFSA
jgi:hypothetical protein